MNNIWATIGLIMSAIANGASWTVAKVSKPVSRYLLGLRRLTTLTFGPPIVISAIAILFGWHTVVGWMGVWCFVFAFLLGHYGLPGGFLFILIEALEKKKEAGETKSDEEERSLIAGALKRYVSFVRTFLMYEALTFLTLNVVPIQNYWVGVPAFALSVGFLIMSSYEWKTETGKWMKPLVRLVVFGIMILEMIFFFFPKVNMFNLVVYRGKPPVGASVTSAKDITEVEVWAGLKKATTAVETTMAWLFDQGNWHRPSFLVPIGILAILVYLLCRDKKPAVAGGDHHEATATAGAHHGDHHGSSGGGGIQGKLVAAGIIALIALILVVIGTKVLDFHERRGARIGAEMEIRKIREIAESERRTTVTTSSSGGGATIATRTGTPPPADPLTIPDGLRGLKNPKMYELTLTTNWSEEIPRPVGQSIRTHPPELLTEMRVNGRKVRTRAPGVFEPIKGTHSFALRLREGPPTTIVVGVGWETSQN